MDARDTHVMLLGLEVIDDAAYRRYRTAMLPILTAHEGRFGCDFVVAEALLAPSPRLNRVFTLEFPDRASRDRFFADPDYRRVRRAHFEPAVRRTDVLAETRCG